MASVLSSPSASRSRHLLELSNDDELQRGRKRRRSSANSPPAQIPSGGSMTLRGRGRRRSQSLSLLSPQTNSPNSQSPVQTRSPLSTRDKKDKPRSASPSRRKYQKKGSGLGDLLSVPEGKKRRDQSPSRSRSVGDGKSPRPRRRQRTRSRSREHGVGGVQKGERKVGDEVAVEDEDDDKDEN